MSLRRLISVLSVVVIASGGLVAAAPKKDDPASKKKATPAPAATGSGSGSGSAAAPAAGSGDAAGSAVAPIEDTPPADMNGTDENPDAPKDQFTQSQTPTAPAVTKHASGYPVEEALRPITLPQNMSEISIAPHFTISPFSATDALRARYGITRQVQIGLTYVYGGVYDNPNTPTTKDYAFHPGKAFGLDVTVLIQNWLAVKVGVPIYIDPVAVGLQIGAPIKFSFGDKFAIGGLDDLLNIRISKFAPSFVSEQENAIGAYNETNNTGQSRGHVRISGYGIYQQKPNLAIIGRIGIDDNLGAGGGGVAGTNEANATQTFIRAGVQLTPKKYLDVGGSLGFDDLAEAGSFGLAGYLAIRI